jgi:predicted dehydrogenase
VEQTAGIIMNGVTGRMGTNQHLVRSILAIREKGGVTLPGGEKIMPDPILVGRNESKLAGLAQKYRVQRYTTDLDTALGDNSAPIYFDATKTELRSRGVSRAIAAGKHIYCEKPTGTTVEEALALHAQAEAAGVKHGVVQDKLWLPGMVKLKELIDSGFFGRILSVRGEFGYWVFDGHDRPTQRPSWNYRSEDGGGIMIDMFCHWRYLLDNLFGEVQKLFALGVTHVPERLDEGGNEYKCTADDAAFGTFILDGDIICQFNSSWAVRVRRDDLLTLQVDGTKGSAVAGLTACRTQSAEQTPLAVWNPDIESPIDYYRDWTEYGAGRSVPNAFMAQWELFIRHVFADGPFPWSLLEGAKGVQMAELGLASWHSGSWVEVPPLT